MFSIQKIFSQILLALILISTLILVGCSSDYGQSYEVGEWLNYSNEELGISFNYPDYYGDPNVILTEGKSGEAFYLQFEVNYKPSDPYLIYVSGTTSDFESENDLVRTPYLGGYAVTEFCDNEKDFINFVDYRGKDCLVLDEKGSLQNYAIVDAVGSSVEQVYLANFPTGKYSGLQAGFRVPFDYVEYGLLVKGDVKGDNAVEDLVDRLDKEDVPKNLIDELGRFRVMLESLQFI